MDKESMIKKIAEELHAVDEDQKKGIAGCTIDELDAYLTEILAEIAMQEVAEGIIARLDIKLENQEEEMLHERINTQFHGEEVSPEFRIKLLEDIRERDLFKHRRLGDYMKVSTQKKSP